jgi:hypothetical protein
VLDAAAALRASLGEASFATALAEGRALEPGEAVALGLAVRGSEG